ncbi:MAG: PAS domain-containing sensor histidine kinase [Syntrophaceae bacterium]|nr:PAS domain-containing sensor histidine kinase [Syntrophaceae bacterium]
MIDYLTGPAFSSLVFYLIPVIFVFWFVGSSAAGILVSTTSALIWTLTDMISGPSYPNTVIPLWNLAEKLGIFFIVVYILFRLAEKEKALKFEHGQFLSILDTTDDLIYISDPESYEILYANNALSNLAGSEIIGKKCYETLQNVQKPCDFCTNKYIFGENKGKPYFWEHWDRVHQRWYRCVDRAIKWPDGRWVRYETAMDISESKKLERERKNMLSMFAHDMKNPTLVAEGFLSRLSSGKAGPLTDKQLNYLELISDAIRRVGKFITNFLEFSRIESGEYKTVPAPFDLTMSIEKNLEALRIEAEKKNIKLIFEVIDGRTAAVHADVTQIDRVLVNLLDNSIKYTNPGGTITVTLSDRDKDIFVQVADTGTGIPEEHLPHLFNPFYRVTEDSKGSGLGLAIVKTIVETNGGRIWVDSIYGKGSTFAFTLPKYRTN